MYHSGGTVGVWRRREGDPIRAGEGVVEIITSKATFDVDSPADGVLRKILAPPKSSVPVGYVLAVVGGRDEALPDVTEENERILAAFHARAAGADSLPADDTPPPTVRATPGARRLARELNVDLASIELPEGQTVIREQDVQRTSGG